VAGVIDSQGFHRDAVQCSRHGAERDVVHASKEQTGAEYKWPYIAAWPTIESRRRRRGGAIR
jgi:hypothetical protein